MVGRMVFLSLVGFLCTFSNGLFAEVQKPQEQPKVFVVQKPSEKMYTLVHRFALHMSDNPISGSLKVLSKAERTELRKLLEQEQELLEHGASMFGLANQPPALLDRGLMGIAKGFLGGIAGLVTGTIVSGIAVACFPGVFMVLLAGGCTCPCALIAVLELGAVGGTAAGVVAGVGHECYTGGGRNAERCRRRIERINVIIDHIDQLA